LRFRVVMKNVRSQSELPAREKPFLTAFGLGGQFQLNCLK
jgi:hypothetical protein